MDELISRYNYDAFVPEKFEQWQKFEASPKIGDTAPDFPLWSLDRTPTNLSEFWSQNQFTIVEFGSFT